MTEEWRSPAWRARQDLRQLTRVLSDVAASLAESVEVAAVRLDAVDVSVERQERFAEAQSAALDAVVRLSPLPGSTWVELLDAVQAEAPVEAAPVEAAPVEAPVDVAVDEVVPGDVARGE